MAPSDPSHSLTSALFEFIAHAACATTMEELQSRYLDGVGQFVASSAAGLYVLNPFTHGTERIAARGVSDFFLSRYEEIGRHSDPVLKRAMAIGGSVDNRQLMPLSVWTDLPVYGEVFRLHRMANLLEVPLVADGAVHGTLNFGRTSAEGAFTARDHVVAEAIARLLAVSLMSARARSALARDRDQVLAALEMCSDAVVVTDLQSAQRRVNGAARRLLACLREAEITLDGLLAGRVPIGDAMRHQATVTLADGTRALLAARSTTAPGDPDVVTTILELIAPTQRKKRAFCDRGLTRREQQVAELAADGLRDAEIAQQLFLSHHTVKQYVKAAYRKLGVRSRVDLARFALGSGGEAGSPDRAEAQVEDDPDD